MTNKEPHSVQNTKSSQIRTQIRKICDVTSWAKVDGEEQGDDDAVDLHRDQVVDVHDDDGLQSHDEEQQIDSKGSNVEGILEFIEVYR